MKVLEGKVALVTGGSRGIGKAIAVALARAGASVAINYVSNDDAALSTKDEIETNGSKCLLLKGDVSSAEDVDRIVSEFLQWGGSRIDILVNNAGVTRDNLLLRMTEADWDRVMDTNLKSVFLLTKPLSRVMIKQRGGRIINITSVIGLMGNAGQANYAASKAGIIGFTKSLAKELGSRQILVNAIAPGFIQSEMTQDLSQETQTQYLERIPLGRFGTGEEVASLVVYLASEGNYLTGQVFAVDGGMSM